MGNDLRGRARRTKPRSQDGDCITPRTELLDKGLTEVAVQTKSATLFVFVKVWDLATRLFHWLLVAAVSTALVTGFLAPEWFMKVHAWAGYVIVALIVFRLVWGLCGPEYSRIAALFRATSGIGEYLKGLLLLRPAHHAGHNPAGAAMILVLMLTLSGLVVSGLMVLGGEEKQGPLAGLLTFSTGEVMAGWHSWLAVALCVMVLAHVAGVAAESLLLKAPLVRAMITGWILLPADVIPTTQRPARPILATVLLAGAGGIIGMGLALAGRLPPLGVPSMPVNSAYQSECGSCHWPFHPSLLPRASWATLMAGLSDHFGEDASLPKTFTASIAAYLEAYAAEAWDTEAGNAMRIVSNADPLRITASPFWIAKHRGVADRTFAAAPVKGRSNCIACHADATTGMFADQAIRATPQTRKGIDQ